MAGKTRLAAVIDIGSHSIRLIIGEKQGGEVKVLELLKNPLLIGRDTFRSSLISQETTNTAIAILQKYRTVIESYQVVRVRVIATTAVREAQNRDIFLDTVLRKTGFEIEVLTVGDVVFYIDTFLYYNLRGRYPIHEKNLLIAELGAGIVDLSIMRQGYLQTSIGLPFGTLMLQKLEKAMEGEAQERALGLDEYIRNELRTMMRYQPVGEIDDIFFISEDLGAALHHVLPDTLAEHTFFEITAGDAALFFEACTPLTADRLARRYEMPLELAATAGLLARTMNAFFPCFRKERGFVIETSLYHALLVNSLFGYGLPQKRGMIDHLTAMARATCTQFNADLAHADHVAGLARGLFTDLAGPLGLTEPSLKYLLLAAYFHDIGKLVSNRSHHKHAQYLIANLNLFRMSESEMNLVSNIARYHRKAIPDPRHLPYQALPARQQILTQKLAAVLRIADALDRSHTQKVKKTAAVCEPDGRVVVRVHAEDPVPLERMSFNDKKDLLEHIVGARVDLLVVPDWS
ncbi:MAG: HD domain-containing protein [Planctomycetota bacterium]